MRANEIYEESGDRVYWYRTGEYVPGNYMFEGGYESYIMPADIPSVHTRKEIFPLRFDPETCVFTDEETGKQYVAWGHSIFGANKYKITEYNPANTDEDAEAFKPEILAVWDRLQKTNWAKVDARVAANRAKRDAKHPIDKHRIRFDNAAGLTLLAIAKEPTKTFTSDELSFGNGGTMSIAFHKLRELGYVVVGKAGSKNTIKITDAGIEAAKYLDKASTDQNQTKIDNAQKKLLMRAKGSGFDLKMIVQFHSNKIDPTNTYGAKALETIKASQEKLWDFMRGPEDDWVWKSLSKNKSELESFLQGIKRLDLSVPEDIKARLIKARLGKLS